MKKNGLKSILCLVLLTAVLAVAVFGVNALTDPVIQARKGTPLFDRSAPESAELAVSADTVQSVYRNDLHAEAQHRQGLAVPHGADPGGGL